MVGVLAVTNKAESHIHVLNVKRYIIVTNYVIAAIYAQEFVIGNMGSNE